MAKKYTELPADTQPKWLGIFVREKRFYQTFFPLLLVIGLQQLAALTVNLVDNIMLGTYTELALSGATLVNQLQFVLQQIAAGSGLGIVVLASQYWGKRQTKPIKRIIAVGTILGFLVGVLFFVVTTLFPSQVLGLFTNDSAVIAEGMRYLHVMRWTYLIFAVSNSLMYAMQSVETAAIGTIMSISTICINLCLNYIFIFGHFGVPEMGIVGAAIATLCSRTVELLIILSYVLFIDKKLQMKFKELLIFSMEYFTDYLKVASPVMISGLMWGVAQGAQTAVLGHISAAVIAANSIASVVFQMFVVFGFACANTSSVVIGKTIGEGRLDMVKAYSKTLQAIFVILGVLGAGLLFLCKDSILDIYAVTEETRQLTLQFLSVLCVTSIASCYEYPVECGIIAGGGSTKYAAIADNLFMWLFTIPSAYLSAFVFGFSPVITFCFLKSDQVLKCIPNAIVCNRYRWVKVLTRE